MLKHFNVWPIGLEKDHMFEEQKIFLMYLMGFVPNWEGWNLPVDYQKQVEEINKLALEDFELEKTDIDLAKLQGRDINQIRKERFVAEKEKMIAELDKKFGFESEEKTETKVEFHDKEDNFVDQNGQKKQLWDILEMKKIIPKKK